VRLSISRFVLLALLGACASRPATMIEEEPPDRAEGGVDVPSRDAAPEPPPRTTPYPRAEITVELPFAGPARTATVTVPASPGRVDVHLAMDTTSSFDDEIRELQRALLTTVIPGLRARVPSLTLGVSRFEDMPFAPFGAETDRPFALLAAQTSDSRVVAAAVDQLNRPLGFGDDRPEAWAEALYQIATGAGLRVGAWQLVPPFVPRSLPDTGREGGVGFRTGSTRVVVLATDAPTHEPADYGRVVPDAHGSRQAIEAMRRERVHVVGIASAPDARSGLEAVAQATGAVAPPERGRCATGANGATRAPTAGVCPLVFDLEPNGSGLSRTIVDGITRLLDVAVYQEVHGEVEDDPHGFVTAVEAWQAEAPADSSPPGRADRVPAGGDGIADTFTAVHARTALTFRLHLRNDAVAASEFPQVFFLRVLVRADGEALREVLVRVIVPEGPKFDAGVADVPGAEAGEGGGMDASGSEAAVDPSDVGLDAAGD
jgi:hypothetical protein